MEQVLDEIVAYLSGTSTRTALPALTPSPSSVTWILGDLGTGDPEQLPFAYVAPLNDAIKPYSTGGIGGVDMDQYTIPVVIVQDQHNFADPIASPANPAVKEHPQYRALLQTVQNVRAALRRNITLGGLVASSSVTEIKYVLVILGGKEYRAARLTVDIKQRRSR